MFFDVAMSLSNFNKSIKKRIRPHNFPRIKQRNNPQYPYHFFLSEKIFSYIIVKSGLRRHQRT